MLVQLRPDKSISSAVQKFKGRSSTIIREELPSLEEFLWRDSFWADGFFADTIGMNKEAIREYIRNQ